MIKDEEYQNQAIMKNSKMINIKNIDKKALCKIYAFGLIGSGFLIEFKKNNNPFYCLLTAAHVIENNKSNMNNDIEVLYNNENNSIKINLNERFKRNYSRYMGIDAFVIEILPEDNVDKSFFLKPNLDFVNDIQEIAKKEIVIIQYPSGEDISISTGEILKVNKYTNEIFHKSSTKNGSSGSPIILLKSKTVIGIHVKGNKKKIVDI